MAIKTLACSKCGYNVLVDEDCPEVTCGKCVQLNLLRWEYDQRQLLAEYTPERLRSARKARKLSQQDLSYQLKKPATYIGDMERGKTQITHRVAEWIDQEEKKHDLRK